MNPTLDMASILLLSINVVGLVLSGGMVLVTLRRRRVADTRRELVITVRRALRMEVGFFTIQIFMLINSVWSLLGVVPDSPPTAITYFFGTHTIRAAVSVWLVLISVWDLRDRREIQRLRRQALWHGESPLI